MLTTQRYKLTGVSPLLMHNGRLADPLNPHAKAMKEISSIRKKSDEDYEELARREWVGGMYEDDEGYPCLPAEAINATIIEGARKSKLGKQFAPAVFVDKDARLKIGDSRKAAELWGDDRYRDTRSVKVTTNKVSRTRPRFEKWSAEIEVQINTDIVNPGQVTKALEDAGLLVGLLDYRPRYGRFEVEAI